MGHFEPESPRKKGRRSKLTRALLTSLDSGISDYEIYDSDLNIGYYNHETADRESFKIKRSSPVPKRYILVMLTSSGMFVMFALRNCLSAIVAMTSNITTIVDGEKVIKEAQFNWSSEVQGLLLSGYFIGSLFARVPGGWLSTQYGGKLWMGLAMFIPSVLIMFTPLAARFGWHVMLAQRIAMGIFLGMVTPCHNVIWSKWAPKYERSKLLTISRGGCHVGSVITMFGSGLIASSPLGWPAIFYFFGGLGIIWYVFWLIFVYESPEVHPTITEREKRYIGKAWSRNDSDTFEIPWRAIFTSPPVWAAIVGQFSEFWILYTMGVCMTIYIKEVLKFNVDQTGFVSAIPNVLLAIAVPTSGYCADLLRKKKIMDTTTVRKVMQGTGLMMCGFLMATMGYVENRIITVTMMSLAIGMMGLCESGALVNYIDIAPKYAGILMGIGQCIATIPGIIGNYLVGIITKNETEAEWQVFFEITLGVCIVGTLIFSIFGSGRKQVWASDYIAI